MQALDELWHRRIVRERGKEAYDFSHDKIREVAYTGLSAARRKLLQRRVAEALATVHTPNQDPLSGLIASPFEQVGLKEPAIQY